MTTAAAARKAPLWWLIEQKIAELESGDLGPDHMESTVRKVASSLDEAGYNVSLEAGKLLQLRWALRARVEVGRPLLEDFNRALSALELEDVEDTFKATMTLIQKVGLDWPDFNRSERRGDVMRMVERTRLDLLIARAKDLDEEEGIRFLLASDVPTDTIVAALEIPEETFARVNAQVEAERAERQRVISLLEGEADTTVDEKVKKLVSNDVADELILELAEVEQAVIDGVREAMKAELEEKRRLKEEAAARKKAETEGPPLEEIPPDQLLEYIESVREILEFSDKEDEIRTMCDQSSIPKCLVDIAVSDPDRLDELEQKAEG